MDHLHLAVNLTKSETHSEYISSKRHLMEARKALDLGEKQELEMESVG